MQYVFVLLLLSFSSLTGFSISNISSRLTYNKAWETEEPPFLDPILSQPFVYLKSGSQSYAFVSQDGKYVIKFFRMKHFAPYFRDLFRPKRAEKKRQNLAALFGAYKLGFERMQEDAGLIYLHLNKTSHLNKKLQIIDREGKTHWIDLDQIEFVVQEKAEVLSSYLKNKEGEAFDRAVSDVMQLIDRRSQKNILDFDQGVSNNFGFVGGRAIQIDIGRIYVAEDLPGEEEHQRILKKLKLLHGGNCKTRLGGQI